ncbi:60s acidic ribosomal protein-domain-containing protein [Catenaria anguillulae PL171]|uniref:60s acidic ribosomal protein-domain-containing protein n=1 Tax=Catenaria anguillulae PL171 TaxID=765915 RepID=A0A1Y2HST7_9FUNG|nr:60s acidic ribosomal protein-domain-containing protein [Catenaria anguillulae PL171]
MSINERAITYAALILADEGIEITADKLATITKAAGVEVDSIWFSLFAKALSTVSITDLLNNVGSGPAAGSAPAAAAGGASSGAAAAEAAPAAKEEEAKEESDEDMGFGLFD